MEPVSLRPLLDALDRAKRATIRDCSEVVSIDEILVSTDFRGGLVASIFVDTDSALHSISPTSRHEIERNLLGNVVRELGGLTPELLRGGKPRAVYNINWLSFDDLHRDYGGQKSLQSQWPPAEFGAERLWIVASAKHPLPATGRFQNATFPRIPCDRS